MLVREKQRFGFRRGFRRALVEFFHLFSDPAHAGDLDFAVRRDPEDGGNVGEPVGVGYRVGMSVVQQDRKRYSVFLYENRRVFLSCSVKYLRW